jgi:hypothetical protein
MNSSSIAMQSKTSLGQVFGFMKTKQYVEAENLLNRLIRKEPKNHLWHELLGLLYVTLNDGVRGKSALEQALSLNPGSHLAWNNYGNAWALVKNTTQALKAYHQALVIAPNHSDAHFNAGRMHLMLAEFDQALILCICRKWEIFISVPMITRLPFLILKKRWRPTPVILSHFKTWPIPWLFWDGTKKRQRFCMK